MAEEQTITAADVGTLEPGCPCQHSCCPSPGGFTNPPHEHNPKFCVACHRSKCAHCGAECAGTGKGHPLPNPPSLLPMIEHHRKILADLEQEHAATLAVEKDGV